MSTASESSPRWFMRRYRAGDEVAILDLFNQEFGKNREMRHWHWKFRDNPYGGPWATLAWSQGGEQLVGTHIVMPFRASYYGSPVLGIHTLDLVVRSGYRGEGIFGKTGRNTIDWCRDHGAKLCIAFPNSNSYPGFVRTLGWSRILYPSRYRLRLRVGDRIRRKVPVPGVGALGDAAFTSIHRARYAGPAASLDGRFAHTHRIVRQAEVPEQYESLWAAVCEQQPISLWKDTEYLRWRYDRHPDHEFEYWLVLSEDVPVALAVVVKIGGALQLCEWIVKDRRGAVGHWLLSRIVRMADQEGCEEVRFLGYDQGYLDEVFGSFHRAESQENVLVGRALGDPLEDAIVSDPSCWAMSFGDTDIV